MHGLPVQSRDAAAYRAVPAARAMILAHMVMNGGKCKTRASRHGVKAKAGRQGMARQDKAVVAKRPVVKLTGTGLAAKRPVVKLTGTGLAVKHPADERPAQAL